MTRKEQRSEIEESGLKTEKYKYVIIGGGTAAHAALVTILQKDPNAKVLLPFLSLPLSHFSPSLPSPSPPLTGFYAGAHASGRAPCAI